MGWLQWGIPLVGLAVWILSNLIKNQQDEARRREMRPRPNPPEEPQRREPPPEVRSRKVERARPPMRPQPAAERPRPRPERVIEAEIVQPPSRRNLQGAEQPIVVAQLVVPTVAPVVAHVAPVVTANRKASKAVQNLHALLKSRNTLATAYLLTEVFGKPKCKRN